MHNKIRNFTIILIFSVSMKGMIQMNSIERFYATVDRKPVDRPACWLGDPTPEAVPALCEYFGVDDVKGLKKECGDDFYAIEVPYHSPCCNAIFAAFDWYMNDADVDTEHRTLTDEGCFADCEDMDDILNVGFEWPDPELYIDRALCRKLVDEAPKDKVIMGMLWAAHFQDVCAAFGMEKCLMNMLVAPEIVHYVNDKIVEFYVKAIKIFLEEVGDKIHAILIGDDVGSQTSLMLSPDLVREFVHPGAKELIDIAHSYGLKVIYHSCGSIIDVIPDLINIGVDVIHPIQALARGMDAPNLKAKFDGQVSFCGGVDTQHLLPFGKPEEVAAKVKELRELFPTGLIISPSHEAVQEDVPPANIKAMFDETKKVY